MIFPIDRLDIPEYIVRCNGRQETLFVVTMNLVRRFVDLGDDITIAKSKVSQLSTEVATYLYTYVLGNKTPLIDGINNSTLPFMDVETKEFVISQL
jgi:hypothetical protein